MLAGGGGVFAVEGELGQEVVDVGLLQAVLAAVGDVEGLLGELGRLGGIVFEPMPAGQGEQDVGLELDELDAVATRQGFAEVALGLCEVCEVRGAIAFGSSGERGVGPAEKPFDPDAVASVRVSLQGTLLPEGQRFLGGFQGLARLVRKQAPLGGVGPGDAAVPVA